MIGYTSFNHIWEYPVYCMFIVLESWTVILEEIQVLVLQELILDISVSFWNTFVSFELGDCGIPKILVFGTFYICKNNKGIVDSELWYCCYTLWFVGKYPFIVILLLFPDLGTIHFEHWFFILFRVSNAWEYELYRNRLYLPSIAYRVEIVVLVVVPIIYCLIHLMTK